MRAQELVLLTMLASTIVTNTAIAGEKPEPDPEPGTCVGLDDAELMTLINAHRVENALPEVPQSRVLTTVAQWHVLDARLNGETLFTIDCTLWSWSDMRPDLWTPVCYTSDHANVELMWSKPAEISGGSFTGIGQEMTGTGFVNPAQAVNAWKNFSAFNDMMLNVSPWTTPWQAIGAGTDGTYYYVWFSTQADPSEPLEPCPEGPPIFTDRFELAEE